MADQIRTNGSAIRRTAFKWVSLALIGSSLLYLVRISPQPSVQDSIARRRQTVLAFFSSWLKTCHERAAQLLIWRYIPWVQKLDAVHLRPSCLPTCSVEHKKSLCGCLVPRATEIDYSAIGYSQPSFPFNVLPGRVESTCQNFSGYALERCQTDVRTRTELFIALVAVFSLVVFCIILITILTCMRRIKARRRVDPASLARKKSKQAGKTFIPGRRKRDNGYLGDISHGQGLTSPQSLNEDEAVEAEEQGIADQDIPVALDGMTDGWMQWIRQRANMVCIFVASMVQELMSSPNSSYRANLQLDKCLIFCLLLIPWLLAYLPHLVSRHSNYPNQHCPLFARLVVLALLPQGHQIKA